MARLLLKSPGLSHLLSPTPFPFSAHANPIDESSQKVEQCINWSRRQMTVFPKTLHPTRSLIVSHIAVCAQIRPCFTQNTSDRAVRGSQSSYDHRAPRLKVESYSCGAPRLKVELYSCGAPRLKVESYSCGAFHAQARVTVFLIKKNLSGKPACRAKLFLKPKYRSNPL